MADNVTLPGTGAVVGSDDVGGVQYQQVKLVDGTLDSTTPIGTNSNPLKTTGADAVSLRTATLTTTGPDTAVDTTGWPSLSISIDGTWSGAIVVESSNDQVDWFSTLVYSVELPIPVDVIAEDGIYSLKPVGKWARLRVTSISGSVSVVILGRSGTGPTPLDAIALAMDQRNNTPLMTQLLGPAGSPVGQSVDGALQINPQMRTYSVVGTAVGTILTMPCADMLNISGSCAVSSGSVLSATMEGFFPSIGWFAIPSYQYTQGAGTGYQQGFSLVQGQVTQFSASLSAAQLVRIRISSYSSGVLSVTTQLTNAVPMSSSNSVAAAQIGTWSVNTNAGTNAIGDVGVQYRANATGAATISKFTAAATTNAASIKATAGRVIGWHLYNTTAAAKYFRFFNKASAPTMGTDSPVFVVTIPANSQAFSQYAGGIAFSTGIAIACTGAVADLDTTVTAANDVLGAFFYA